MNALALIQVVLAVKIAFHYLIARFISYSGDEELYLSTSKHLLALEISNLHTGLLDAVGPGWFSFGMSVLLCPMVLVSDQPEILRLLMSLLNLLVSAWVFSLVLQILSPRFTAVLFIAYSLNPMSLFFSTTIWADYLASQLFLVASLYVYLGLNDERRRRPVVVGFLIGTAMLLRPPLMLGYFALILGGFLVVPVLSNATIKGSSRFFALSIVVSTFLYSPWVYFLSTKMEAVVLTTVTTDVNFIRFFSNRETKRKIKANSPNGQVNIYTTHNYIQKKSELNGRSFPEELKRHRKAVISELTLSRYFGVVTKQIRRYLFNENGFLQGRFYSEFQGEKSARVNLFFHSIGIVNTTLWYSLLIAFAWIIVTGGLALFNTSPQILYSTPFLMSFLVQPFVSVAHPRYISGFISIYLVWIVIDLLTQKKQGIDDPAP